MIFPLKAGDCIRLFAGTKPNRPGVVMRFANDGALVIATGTHIDRSDLQPEPVFVDFPSDDASDMKLTMRTWFTQEGLERVSLANVDRIVEKYCGACPKEVFLTLCALHDV